jgi:hypothetical protein
MSRILAAAAALALSASALAAETPLEAQVNARLDAQLRRTLHRLADEARHTVVASSANTAQAPRLARAR